VDGDERGGGIVFFPKKLEDLQLPVAFLESLPRPAQIGLEGFIPLFDRQAPDLPQIIEIGAQLFPRLIAALQGFQPGKGLTGLFLVLPEIRLRGLSFYLPDVPLQGIRVKDPSMFLRSGR
jgi:hypothetical protein